MKLTLLKTFLVLLGLSHSAAQSAPQDYPPEPDWQQAFMLRVGENQASGGATLLFDAVAEDSRCPPDMLCYWPGEATLNLTLRSDDETEFSLRIGGFDNILETSSTLKGGYRVKLLWLSQQGEYRAVFMVANETP